MKKIILMILICCNVLFGLEEKPYYVVTEVRLLKNDVMMITLGHNQGEIIVKKENARILKNEYNSKDGLYNLIIKDIILFNERKILIITEEQYKYLKKELYDIK